MTKPPYFTKSLAVLAGAALLLHSTTSEARGFWDVFFGHEEEQEGPPPEKTLQAPFGKVVVPKGQHTPLMDIYGKTETAQDEGNIKNLEQPNISSATAAIWAAQVASEALTIDPHKFDSSTQRLSKKFIPYALQEYQTYLKGTNLLPTLQQSNMTLNAMATGPGVIVREGVLAGAYHWVISVPILITYYSDGVKSLDKSIENQSQNLNVELQIGRVTQETRDDNGIRVEHWRVSAAR